MPYTDVTSLAATHNWAGKTRATCMDFNYSLLAEMLQKKLNIFVARFSSKNLVLFELTKKIGRCKKTQKRTFQVLA